MSEGDSAPDGAAWLAAFAGLPGIDGDVMRQARQAMAAAMSAGAEQQALLARQWAVMQATAAAVCGDEGQPSASGTPLGGEQQLALARAYFNVAVDAVQALSEAATIHDSDAMDQIVRRFYEQLSQIGDRETG